MEETGRPIYALMFDEHGMQTLRFSVLASNEKVRSRISREPDQVSGTTRPDGSGADAIHHFQVTRERYYELRARRAERDEQFRRKREELRQQRGYFPGIAHRLRCHHRCGASKQHLGQADQPEAAQ
jgi:hypothetical protein